MADLPQRRAYSEPTPQDRATAERELSPPGRCPWCGAKQRWARVTFVPAAGSVAAHREGSEAQCLNVRAAGHGEQSHSNELASSDLVAVGGRGPQAVASLEAAPLPPDMDRWRAVMGTESNSSWRDRAGQLAPFAAVVALAFVLGVVSPHIPETGSLLIWAGCCFALVAVILVAVPPRRRPPGSGLAVLGLICVGVAFLRDSGGGIGAGYGSLLLLPVIWHALYGRRLDLAASIAAIAGTYIVPIVAIGAPEYPASQWRTAVLFTVIGGALGVIVQNLMRVNAALADRLAALANMDSLTGLPNRRAWDKTVGAALTGGLSTGAGFIVLIDLDHFKAFNDLEGHVRADQTLHAIAARWAPNLGPDDLLARWGGEEFALLLPNTDSARANSVLRHLAAATPDSLTFSAGLVGIAEPTTLIDAMSTADDLLYLAKTSGRACVAASRLSESVGGTERPAIDRIFAPPTPADPKTTPDASPLRTLPREAIPVAKPSVISTAPLPIPSEGSAPATAFEEALRAEVHEHAPEWMAERERHQAEVLRFRERQAQNIEAVAGFIDAMAVARCRPHRWKVRSRTLDGRRQRHRPMTGWLFAADGASYFVSRTGDVFILERAKIAERGRGTIHQPEPASPASVLYAAGLAAAYRAATNGRDIPQINGRWL